MNTESKPEIKPSPIFFIGNKRSGTTFLMKLLNHHEDVFISNESDIVWILYCLSQNKPLVPYKWDSPKGFDLTIKEYGEGLSVKKGVREAFFDVLSKMMIKGFNSMPPQQKKEVKLLGDQKMFQHADPEIIPFILEEFPDAKFLHIIRHPYHVIRSSLKFSKETGAGQLDNIWNNMSISEIEDRWLMHENWVMEAKEKYNIRCLDIRYEDLVWGLEKELKRIATFLNITMSNEFVTASKRAMYVKVKPTERFELNSETEKIVAKYGLENYKIMYTESALKLKLINIYFGVKRVLTRHLG